MAVTCLEITSRERYWNGSYERLRGTMHFAADPSHAANRAIVDLDKAPRDADGRVHFKADFGLVQPVDADNANRRLLFFVVNRGRQTMPFNRPPVEPVPTDKLDPGDGFLMRRGWTVAFCGWQWDVEDRPELIGLEAPMAMADGQPIQGQIAVQFQPNEPHSYQRLAHYPLHPPPGIEHMTHRAYPAADIAQADAVLTVRDAPEGPRTTIPRDRWRFAREVGGEVVADDSHVWSGGGFQPGRLYEVVYRTRIAPVVGAGLLAVRDCTAFLHHADAEAGNPCAGRVDFTYGYGISQCGRFLRELLYRGLNVDEAGRRVFDGLIPHVAGARRGEFNHRFAQPSAQHARGFGHLPPFADDDMVDPFGGQSDGLLKRQRELGGVPKILHTNSSSEYWRIDCSLIHTDPAGQRDVEPPDDARVYLLAGTQHGPGALPLTRATPAGARGANDMNVVDYSPLMRAAIVNLDEWVSASVSPPPSLFPRLADGTAVTREVVIESFPERLGGSLPDPDLLPVGRSADLGPEAAAGVGRFPAVAGGTYRCYVSAVDADGNEVAGVRLPDLTVPLGAFTGWNPRDPSTGGVGQILDMQGSTLPLGRDETQRRYGSRDAYLAKVRAAAEKLAADRYLVAEDVDLVVANAGARWDALTAV